MENLCHTLVGGALARAGLDRLSPYATPMLLVSANFPDADIVMLAWGNLVYLEHHRGLTHGLAPVVVEALGLAALAVGADRLMAKRAGREPRARFWRLAVAALAGLLSHVLLDYSNSYGVRPLLPFDSSWFYGDKVFVVDPCLWLILGGALCVGAAAGRLVTWSWAALFAILTLLVGAVAWSDPTTFGSGFAVWAVLVALVAFARLKFGGHARRELAAAALAGTCLYWGMMTVASRLADRRLDAAVAGERIANVRDRAVLPTLMRPDVWRAVVETDETLYATTIRLGGDATEPFERLERNLDAAPERAALATCPGRLAADFNRFLFATREPLPEGGTTVVFRDARFDSYKAARGVGIIAVELDANDRPSPDARTCTQD